MNKSKQRREFMRQFRKNHPVINRRRVKDAFDKHPTRYAHQRHASELRCAIRKITGINVPRLLSLERLYRTLVKAVKKQPLKSKSKFPHGIPDAEKHNVEFKLGLDRLHAGQIVRDILNGRTGKVRWFPSNDSIEAMFSRGENESRLFESYKEFISWRYGVQQ